MNWWLFLIPVTSAFSCWLVIKLFFTLLFHPRNPRSIFGIKIQGILPAKRSIVAGKTGKLVAAEFISMKIIEEKITDPSHLQKIMPVIEEHIDDFLRNKLKKEMPVVGLLIGEKTINSLKKVFMNELETLFPKIITGFVSNIVTDLNIEQLITEKINTVSIIEVETAFRKNFSKELRLAEMAAGLIGLFFGILAMMIIFYFK
ncbi:MAG: DUF445 domain-containing protein [Chitinophagales bacterium]